MSVRIRLRRIGRKKQPSYRLVVADSATPRDGMYLEAVGFYNPRMRPAELRLDLERVEQWLDRGANMSDTVASLVRTARKGGDATIELKPILGASRPAAAQPAPPADVEPAQPAGGGGAATPSAEPAPAPSSQAEGVGTAVTEATDASAEARREAGGTPAQPGETVAKAEPAGAEPPE